MNNLGLWTSVICVKKDCSQSDWAFIIVKIIFIESFLLASNHLCISLSSWITICRFVGFLFWFLFFIFHSVLGFSFFSLFLRFSSQLNMQSPRSSFSKIPQNVENHDFLANFTTLLSIPRKRILLVFDTQGNWIYEFSSLFFSFLSAFRVPYFLVEQTPWYSFSTKPTSLSLGSWRYSCFYNYSCCCRFLHPYLHLYVRILRKGEGGHCHRASRNVQGCSEARTKLYRSLLGQTQGMSCSCPCSLSHALILLLLDSLSIPIVPSVISCIIRKSKCDTLCLMLMTTWLSSTETPPSSPSRMKSWISPSSMLSFILTTI